VQFGIVIQRIFIRKLSWMHISASSPSAPDDQGKAVGQIIARSAVELHPLAVLASDYPKAIVLDFMQPQFVGRWLWG
jgi:hypothetical protein